MKIIKRCKYCNETDIENLHKDKLKCGYVRVYNVCQKCFIQKLRNKNLGKKQSQETIELRRP